MLFSVFTQMATILNAVDSHYLKVKVKVKSHTSQGGPHGWSLSWFLKHK